MSDEEEKATARLWGLCVDNDWHPPLAQLEHCVDCGADVLYTGPTGETVLYKFVETGHVKAVIACLRTPHRVDLGGRRRYREETPLHLACKGDLTDDQTAAILYAIVHRLQTHPHDQVDWRKLDDLGRDFLTVAAQYQKLAVVWPLVAEMPVFGDQLEPVQLGYGTTVWRGDWEQLRQEKKYFNIQRSKMLEVDSPTAQLCKLALLPRRDAAAVLACVQEGADILLQKPGTGSSILHHFILEGDVACVKALLTTSHPIDFTLRGSCGRTPLHCICATEPPTAAILLDAVLCRLERCPLDPVDWDLRDRLGHDLVSAAAESRQLVALWQVLRKHDVKHFAGEGKVWLHAGVHLSEWQELAQEDRERLVPVDGVFE